MRRNTTMAFTEMITANYNGQIKTQINKLTRAGADMQNIA
jgi:hypothetical protein